MRQLAISKAPAKDILALSDRLRDVDLVPLGVALDDQEGSFILIPSMESRGWWLLIHSTPDILRWKSFSKTRESRGASACSGRKGCPYS